MTTTAEVIRCLKTDLPTDEARANYAQSVANSGFGDAHLYAEAAAHFLKHPGTHANPIRYEHIDPTDPDRQAKRAAQREQFEKDAKAGKILCLSDLMISHGL